MLRPVTGRLAPSSNPYAFRLSDWERSYLGRDGSLFSVTVPAIWLGRKNGVTTVTYGTYRFYADARLSLSESDTIDDLAAKADTRYGGDWEGKLIGDVFLLEPTHPVPLEDQPRVVEFLRGILADPENLPAGWAGWYRR